MIDGMSSTNPFYRAINISEASTGATRDEAKPSDRAMRRYEQIRKSSTHTLSIETRRTGTQSLSSARSQKLIYESSPELSSLVARSPPARVASSRNSSNLM